MKIDISKKYRTRSGLAVELHEIELLNSAGREVTFPVKGSIVSVSASGRKSFMYQIWKLNGNSAAVDGWEHPYDLIEVEGSE